MGNQSEQHVSRGDRNVVVWLLFAVATTMALLFLQVGHAYAEDAAATSSDASNSSDGSAATGTGNAGATGNQANTNAGQGASVAGHNGSIHVVRQSSTVNNNGVAVANTGGNTANGNTTDDQTAATGQLAVGGGIANNNGNASNSSSGSAGIATGDANAVGNNSSTNINQEANVDAVGGLGAIVIVTQDADVNNTGVGLANTGGNTANGNTIDDQTAVTGQGALALGSIANNQGTSSNKSSGSAGIDTGDANAVGNNSNTGVTQIANVNAGGSLGAIVFVRQRADVDNIGVAAANTGGNTAVGNVTDDQTGVTGQLAGAGSILGPPGGTEIASNDGTASNSSQGDAAIRTGNATAVGNHSNTQITQAANTHVTGGGFVVTDQEANVNNIGVGLANTGLNTAVGNVIDDQVAVTPQLALAIGLGGAGDDTAIAGNFGSATNSSTGKAAIGTGDASASGNVSATGINQTATAAIDGDGFIVPIQRANVNNIGVGIANTGLNLALGNITDDQTAVVPQLAVALVGGGGDDVAVGGNFGQASNKTEGSAAIGTGDATAMGNNSATGISQGSGSWIGPNAVGFIVPVQTANVNNIGVGIANTGLNLAVGNVTDDQVAVPVQIAVGLALGGGDDIATAGNFGEAKNSTAGSATIGTGAATATGNSSSTSIGQGSTNLIKADGDPFIVPIQSATVNNIGVGVANTGLNLAVGNITDDQTAVVLQLGVAVAGGAGDDTAIAGNFGTARNSTNGSAEIATGDACAAGNNSTTYIIQGANSVVTGVGFIVPIQTADVNNIGVGVANSGLNLGLGNVSDDQVAVTAQAAVAVALGGGDDLATASNDGISSNSNNGTARIHTGDANAEGNRSATGVSQTSNALLAGVGFVVPIQSADVNNVGVAIANSGLNAAVGNIADDQIAVTPQAAIAVALGGGDDAAIANNTGVSSNSNSGTADITTGDACAAGNVAANVVNQNSNVLAPLASFVVTIQDAEINNIGVGIANTGLNTALGNLADDQIAVTPQLAVGIAAGPGDDLGIANNIAKSSNSNSGSAGVTTGNATATGNWATNGVGQEANTLAGGPLNLTLQDQTLNNIGVGLANTGLNNAQGNQSDDQVAITPQLAVGLGLGGAADDLGIANNTANTSNSTDGTAAIATGNATATGNQAWNLSCQATNGVCPDLAFPPLPEPLCPCHKKPEVVVTPPTPVVPPKAPQAGATLPVTGGPLAAQALLGLLLVALGTVLRRRRQTV